MKDRSLVVIFRRTRTKGAEKGLDADLIKLTGPHSRGTYIAEAMKNDVHSGQTMARRHKQKVKRE